MEEVWLGENLLAFDGRVLELFGHPATPSSRFHVASLDLTIGDPDKKGRRMFTLKAATKRSGGVMVEIGPEDWPTIEPFLDRVFAAIPE